MMKGFVAYSKADSSDVARLMVHLKGLEQAGLIETWHDRQLMPGEEWDAKIRAELEAADVIIFCVSADLLANHYIQRVEIPKAMDRRARNEAAVIPIIFRKCDWEDHVLGSLQGIPVKGRTVQDYIREGKSDDVWTDVTGAVRDAVRSRQQVLNRSRPPSAGRMGAPRTRMRSIGAKPVILSETRQASDLERDDFTRATFATIAGYFEASLENLKQANPSCETRFNKPSEDAFEASVYVNGKRCSHCGIFIQNRMGFGGIGYASNGVGDRNSYNEHLSLASGDSGNQLRWQALMNVMHQGTEVNTSKMGSEEAAAYLWSFFIKHF